MSVLSITFAKISAKAARFYNFDKIALQNPLSSALPTLPPQGEEKSVIASDSVAIPVSKVRGIYSAHYSNGLPRSLCSLAMTVIRFLLRGKWHEVPIGDKKITIIV